MSPNDARDIAIHQCIESLVSKIAQANGWTRRQALERFVGFLENDEDSPRFTTKAGRIARLRPRKSDSEEVRA